MTLYRSPDFIPLNELGRYGEDHTDPLVRKMGMIVTDVAVALEKSGRSSDVSDWLEDIEFIVDSLKSDVDEADEHAREIAEQLETAVATAKSLRYELSKDRQANVIKFLKAEIADADKKAADKGQKIIMLEYANAKLTKQFNDLQEKYNTWTAIAT